MTENSDKIQSQNDQFRREVLVFGTSKIPGRAVFTHGIACLDQRVQGEIVIKVRTFKDFKESNDPHGEHDFGAFDQPEAGKVFWKIDYYDTDYAMGSEDPADPAKTCRVLTIMLAQEY